MKNNRMDEENGFTPPQKIELFKGKEETGQINLINAPIQFADNEGMVFIHNGFGYGDLYPEYTPEGHQAYDAYLTHDENKFGDNNGSIHKVVENQSTWNTSSFGLTTVNCAGANNNRIKVLYFLNPPKPGEGVLYNVPILLPEQEPILVHELLKLFTSLNDGLSSHEVKSVGMPILVRRTQTNSAFFKALLNFANTVGFKSNIDIYLPEGEDINKLVETAKQYSNN